MPIIGGSIVAVSDTGSGALRDGASTLPSNRVSCSKRISRAGKARCASAWRLAARARDALRPAWAKSTSREGAPLEPAHGVSVSPDRGQAGPGPLDTAG